MDYSPGLRGVIAGETAISTVGREGTSLRYRGYDAVELTKKNAYEDVAALIVENKLDGSDFKNYYKAHFVEMYDNNFLNSVLDEIKDKMHPMDVLKVITSLVGEYEGINRLDATAKLCAVNCYVISVLNDAVSTNFINEYVVASSMLKDNVSSEKIEALDDILILYAEHGFNASTFATRVTASTRSDLTSSIVSGIGTLKGELHGGANEKAVKMITQFSNVNEAKAEVLKLLEAKKKIMGFGHGVYKIQDPRSPIVKSWVEKLSTSEEAINRFKIAKEIDSLMDTEKKLFPNVDFYGGLLLYELGFDIDLFTPIFVAGRIAGWSAHYFEQHDQDVLIRPAAKYIGPSER
ncbi:MAG: 2-methylcitrate synthase [Actinomycetota bacterium]|nr:2-methylcitrate synthase [Actinomycetota bacterium]MDA3013493.1 2-methylcitrate synthase [Actinomycetota bacterium]